MRRLHLATGLLALAAFLASGQNMDRAHDHLRGLDDVTRMLFRSTHIYLLCGPAQPGAGAVPGATGAVAAVAAAGWVAPAAGGGVPD
jgi:hypothetical protein